MKRRYLYMILFGVPGLVVALVASVLALGATAGMLWIFVFGDSTWPNWVEQALPVALVAVFLAVWLACLAAGYVIGKRLEQRPLNKWHVLISAGITLLSIAFILAYQTGVGNIGAKTDEARCSEFCTRSGYFASSVSPRNAGARSCGCLNNSGAEVITVPVGNLDGNK
jgi:hypothetical protein